MLLETWLFFASLTLFLFYWRLKKKSKVLDLFFSIWLIVFGVVSLVNGVSKVDTSYKVIEKINENKTIEYYPFTISFKEEQPLLFEGINLLLIGLGLIVGGKTLWGGGE